MPEARVEAGMLSTSIEVLGPLGVRVLGTPVAVTRPKIRSLLAVLVAHVGRPVGIERLVDELWEDEPPPSAAAAVKVYVSDLRKVIGGAVQWSVAGYQLNVADGGVDVSRFEALVAAARAGREVEPAASMHQLEQALALWRDTPYGNCGSAPSIAMERERLQLLRHEAICMRFEIALGLGRHAEIIPELESFALSEPTNELVARRLMIALHRVGRRAEVEEVYARLCAALAKELEVSPQAETDDLVEQLRRDDPTLHMYPNSIPVPRARFIGRRRELDELGTVLSSTRLLSIVGPCGMGKSSLAVQLVREGSVSHPDGCHWLDFADSTDFAALQRINQAVIGKRALLVLDNCDRSIESARLLVTSIQSRSPHTRLLVTSRVPLELPGETVWRASGLAVGRLRDRPADALRSDAVRLILSRAEEVRPGFRLGAESAAAAVALCRRLEGWPLALEMAAEQLRGLSLPELAARTQSVLDLHYRDGRGAGHRSMLAAVEESHSLLKQPAQRLFRRLSVFRGTFALDAVEAVCADGATPGRINGELVHELLLDLVDHSVLEVAATSRGGDGLRTRYRLRSAFREYGALELAASGEAEDVRARVSSWSWATAQTARSIADQDRMAAVNLIRPDEASLVTSLRASLDGGDVEAAGALAFDLVWYWREAGKTDLGRRLLDDVATHCPDSASTVRLTALLEAAGLARWAGDVGVALARGQQALEQAQSARNSVNTVLALNGLAVTAHVLDERSRAVGFALDGRWLALKIDDSQSAAVAANNAAIAFQRLGREAQAKDLLRLARDEFMAIGEAPGMAAVEYNLTAMDGHQDMPGLERLRNSTSMLVFTDMAEESEPPLLMLEIAPDRRHSPRDSAVGQQPALSRLYRQPAQ